MLVCWLPYFGCIQDLELDYVQPSCCRSFSAAKILPNPKLKKKIKEKNFMPNFRYKLLDLGLLRGFGGLKPTHSLAPVTAYKSGM